MRDGVQSCPHSQDGWMSTTQRLTSTTKFTEVYCSQHFHLCLFSILTHHSPAYHHHELKHEREIHLEHDFLKMQRIIKINGTTTMTIIIFEV